MFYVPDVPSFFYVPSVPPFFYVPYVPSFFCVSSSFYVPHVSSFIYVLYVPSFLGALRAFIILRALSVFIFTCLTYPHFYVPYVPSLFLRGLHDFIFILALRALTFSSVSNFYCVLRAFAFLYKTWYNPEPTATSWYKQERGRTNGK